MLRSSSPCLAASTPCRTGVSECFCDNQFACNPENKITRFTSKGSGLFCWPGGVSRHRRRDTILRRDAGCSGTPTPSRTRESCGGGVKKRSNHVRTRQRPGEGLDFPYDYSYLVTIYPLRYICGPEDSERTQNAKVLMTFFSVLR